MKDFEERLRAQLPTNNFGELHQLLEEFRDQGGSSEDALAVLKRLRAEANDERIEDRILELMDVATGYCPPHLRIW